MKTAITVMLASGLLSCPSSDPPRATVDPGQCWEQPASAEHSHGDQCMPDIDADREPNGRLTSAAPVAPGFLTGAGEITGSLGDGDDVDMFSVPGFALGSSPTKQPVLTFSADDGSQLCAFFSCSYGLTSLEGAECSGTDAKPVADGGASSTPVRSHLDEGTLGCCRKGSGTLRVRVVCDNTHPQVSGFVAIESVGEGCHDNRAYHVTMSLVDATTN